MEEIDLFKEMEEAVLLESGFRVCYNGYGNRFFENGDIRISNSVAFPHLFILHFGHQSNTYCSFQEILQYIKDNIEEEK